MNPVCRMRTSKCLVATLTACAIFANGCLPAATSQLSRQEDSFDGAIDFSTERLTTFTLSGTEPSLGTYTASGEVTFQPDGGDDMFVGDGVAVFEDADGDLLVAVVHWPLKAEENGKRAGDAEFRWRDSVQFSDGTTVLSTGKFANAEDRPPGLVVIAIIAILISTLCPCVQCCEARRR